MLRHELYGMIQVPRLKDENAAELFLGFRIGAVGGCDFAVFPVEGQGGFRRLKRFFARPMPVGAKMVVVFKALSNIACRSPSVMLSNLPLLDSIPNRCISLFFSSLVGASSTAVADFSVTVSSNEAQHILIQKSLTQQVLVAISPAG